MEAIDNELRLFIKDITLFLQNHSNYTPEKMETMFQRAYKLYVKYDVENEQLNPVDEGKLCRCSNPSYPLGPCVNCGGLCPL